MYFVFYFFGVCGWVGRWAGGCRVWSLCGGLRVVCLVFFFGGGDVMVFGVSGGGFRVYRGLGFRF